MAEATGIDSEERARYELLPIDGIYEQAAELPQQVDDVVVDVGHGLDDQADVQIERRDRVGLRVPVGVALAARGLRGR